MVKVFEKAMSSIKGVRTSIDVDIRDNYLNDKKLAGIINLIESNPMITKLCLLMPSNFITDRGFKDLVTAISNNCKDLKSLTINVDW